MKFKITSLGAVLALLCGNTVFAKDQWRQNFNQNYNQSAPYEFNAQDQWRQNFNQNYNQSAPYEFNAQDQWRQNFNQNYNQSAPYGLKYNSASYIVSNDGIVLTNWMTTYYDSIKNKLLKDIIIPGTHDSGTAVIPKEGAVWSSDGRGVNISFSEADENFCVPWSKTQDLTIKEQLDIGVRFFDFRVSVEEGNELYLSHGLRGENVSDSLAAISEFCAKYPKELVIIKVKGFPDKKCKKVNANQLIVQKFEEYLGGLLISRKNVSNLPLTNYSDLIRVGNVVVLFDARIKNRTTNKLVSFKAKEAGLLMQQALRETDWLFDGQCLESHHANTVSTEKLFNFSREVAQQIESDRSRKNKLFALHWTLTANAQYIAGHVNNIDGIRYLTNKLNGEKSYNGSYRLEDLIQQIPRVNIVQHDFIDKNKSAYLIRLNLITPF